jgi:hypothetical protein
VRRTRRRDGGVQDLPESFQIGEYLLFPSPGLLHNSNKPVGIVFLKAVNPDIVVGENEFG